jgi:hypothetical protein
VGLHGRSRLQVLTAPHSPRTNGRALPGRFAFKTRLARPVRSLYTFAPAQTEIETTSMEAERINAIAEKLTDLAARGSELRRYL